MDLNFYDALKELNKNKINYWVCHGSLLGLARDGQLIPWDHDIDLAVWEGDYSEQYIINLFEFIGFKFDKNHPLGSLKFTRIGGRSIDVNFYKTSPTSSELACVVHRLPSSKLASLIDKVVLKKKYSGNQINLIILNLFKFFRWPLIPIYGLLNKFGYLYTFKGYTTPKNLLVEFIEIDYFDIKCKVPEKYKKINIYIYGKDWRIPNQKYNWMKDSDSVQSQ